MTKFSEDSIAGAPSFIRLDEYDAPFDPDLEAISQLLEREYPTFFKK